MLTNFDSSIDRRLFFRENGIAEEAPASARTDALSEPLGRSQALNNCDQVQNAPVVPPRPGGGVNPGPSAPSTIPRSTGPQVPPRTSKHPFLNSTGAEPPALVPPPRPPKSSAPPLPSRSPQSPRPSHASRSRTAPHTGPTLDENIARLMDMGYSYDDVNRALSIAQNNCNVAAQILQNFVPTFS